MVHEATTHPEDTVYLANVRGPIAYHGPDGTITHISNGDAMQRALDARALCRLAGASAGRVAAEASRCCLNYHATDRSMSPLDVAVEAEARGFHGLYLPEHTHIPGEP